MKRARLVWTVMIVLAMTGWVTAYACKDKKTAAAASSACPATASCPANSAQCAHAKNSAAAVTASSECPYHQGAAAAVATENGCAHHADASAASAEGGCQHHGAAAVTADMAGCSAHGRSAMAAGACNHDKGAAAAAGMSGCPHSAGAMAAASGCMHGTAMAASMGCLGHDASAKGDVDCQNCASCADMANCERELESVGAVIQVVRLKNGVMYVYTADGPAKVRAVQSALARRGDAWGKLAAAVASEKLCPPCKEMRGAAASGKLARETVNIEGGCLTLMTSNDPGVVKKIYAMAGIQNAARAKS